MFSIKIPGQNSWPLVVPGADKWSATRLTLLTHINYMRVNSRLHFISFRFRNSNSLTLLKVYCLSRSQILWTNILALKIPSQLFIVQLSKKIQFAYLLFKISIFLFKINLKFFKTLLSLQNSSNAENAFPYPERPKQCLGTNKCVPNLLRKLCGFYPTKKGQTRKRRIGQRLNTLWYPKSSLTSLQPCRPKRRVKIAVEP